MAETQSKSVFIEGDKSFFSSKGAVDRFKRDLKNDDKEKLEKNDYFKEDWTYQVLSNENNEIKVKLVNNKDLKSGNQPRTLDCDERRQMLKLKIKQMRGNRCSPNQMKIKMKGNVPDELASLYIELKKNKNNISLPDPSEVLAKPDEYKNVIFTMIQSFGLFNGQNNPVINYYRLLAKHLGLPTNYVPQQTQQPQMQNVVKQDSFIDKLREDRDKNINMEVDEEMKKIYESLGISMDEKDNKDEEDDKNDVENKPELNKSMEV